MTAPLPSTPYRAERSLLSVPASTERFFAKAAVCAADTIMLDLEDAVAPAEKDSARARAVAAVNGVNWGTKSVLVRINGLDTPWAYRDLVALAEACPRLDGVMVPKVSAPRDVHFVETLLDQVALSVPRERPLYIEAQMESALGLVQIEATAACSRQLRALHFGPGDFGASLGTSVPRIGGPAPHYVVLTDADPQGRRERHWSDVQHYPLARMATAAHAFGVSPIDGPYVDFNDPEGFRAAAHRARALGCEGKWCIHPSQIELANEIFSPSAAEIAWAETLLAAMSKAHAEGAGAVTAAGQMVDLAHVRQAERILAKQQPGLSRTSPRPL
jgi:malyl-CoA/(S)-citramalyl-CoA lyase